MSSTRKLEEMKSIEQKNKSEKDELKMKNDILKTEIELLKRKLENQTQLMHDHENEKQNLEQCNRMEIRMLKVCLSPSPDHSLADGSMYLGNPRVTDRIIAVASTRVH